LDEIWSFIGATQKNVTPEMREKNPEMGHCCSRALRGCMLVSNDLVASGDHVDFGTRS
jgi:hypothetical protein